MSRQKPAKGRPGKITFDTVRKMGLALPGTEEGTAYGSPALKIRAARGKSEMFACLPAHKSAEPGSLAVRVSFDQRQELLDAAPDVFYLTDHYVSYPCVLVRLSRVHEDVLRDLLRTAALFVSRKAKHSPRRPASGPDG